MISVIHCSNVSEPDVYIYENTEESKAKEKLVTIYCSELNRRLDDCRNSFIADDKSYAVVEGLGNLDEMFLVKVKNNI